jgi:glutamate/tyrosine decarboxylase-like PLP-dependent enzyme
VCKNEAPYITASSSGDGITSSLDISLANSSRFRSLPVYAILLAYGITGLQDMFARQVLLAREVTAFLFEHPDYQLLPDPQIYLPKEIPPGSIRPLDLILGRVHICVLFRARDERLNEELTTRLNATGNLFVTGTKWAAAPGEKLQTATRIAVSTWKVDVSRDFRLLADALQKVLEKP